MEIGQLLVLTLTFMLLQPCMPSATTKGKMFTSRNDQRLALTPLTSRTFSQGRGGGKARCLVWCQQVANCKSVNHHWDSATSSVTCQALDKYLHQVAGGTTAAAGWNFLQEDPVWTSEPMGLAFRVTTGNGVSVYDTWFNASRHDNPLDMPGCVRPLSSSEPCTSHFRSHILDTWTNIDKVKVELYKNNVLQKQVTFNGQGSTMTSWLDKSRLLTSSWSDMTPTAVANDFSFNGLSTVYRRFYLSNYHAGCPGDYGWMVVSDVYTSPPTAATCNWEININKPAVLYLPTATSGLWETTRLIADYMMVYVSFL